MTGLSHSSVDLHLNQYICLFLAKGKPENVHGSTAQSPASADTSASSRVTQKLDWHCVAMLIDRPVNRENMHTFYTQRLQSCLLQYLAVIVHTSHRHHQHYPGRNKHPYSIRVIMITSVFSTLSTFPPSSVNVKEVHKETYIMFWTQYASKVNRSLFVENIIRGNYDCRIAICIFPDILHILITKKTFSLARTGLLLELDLGTEHIGERLVPGPLSMGSGCAQPKEATWDPHSHGLNTYRRCQRGQVRCMLRFSQRQRAWWSDPKARFQEDQCGFRPWHVTVDQLYILNRSLRVRGSPTNSHVLCGLGEGIQPCLFASPVGGYWEIRLSVPLIQAVCSLYD